MARVRHQLPAWSKKKRITVGVMGTLGILFLAYILGGGGYVLGMKLGLIQSNRNIKMEVFEKVIEDPKIVAAVQQSARAKVCVNNELGLKIQYQHPLTSMTDAGKNACLQWILPNVDGTQARIIVSKIATPQSELIDSIVEGMEQLLTDSVQRANLPGTVVMGMREDQSYQAYVLESGPTTTWLVELLPANDATRPSLEYLVSHMEVVE